MCQFGLWLCQGEIGEAICFRGGGKSLGKLGHGGGEDGMGRFDSLFLSGVLVITGFELGSHGACYYVL